MKEKIKKLGKKLLIAILIILILIGALITTYQFKYNFAAKINDYTNGEKIKEYSEEIQKLKEENESVGLFANNIESFTEEDAKIINDSILDITNITDGTMKTVLKSDANDQLNKLTKGDIFYLEGDETTPYETAFFGKVVSISQGQESTVLITETPMIDEVFDMIDLDFNEEFTGGDIADIKPLMEDVTISYIGNNGATYATLNEKNNTVKVDNLTNLKIEDEEVLQTKEHETSKLDIKLEADLSKQFKKFLYDDEKKEEEDDDEFAEPYMKIVLEAALKEFIFDGDIDIDIFGIHNMKLELKDEFSYGVKFEAGIKGELGGEKTEGEFLGITASGLDQKLFPLFFIDFKDRVPLTIFTKGGLNNAIEEHTQKVPLTLGLIAYLDLEGNIKFSTSLELKHETKTYNTLNLVENDEWKMKLEENNKKETTTLKLEGKLKFSGDFHLGVSAQLYVGTINVIDIAIVKIGTEAEVEGELSASIIWENDKVDTEDEATLDGFLRIYLKFLDIDIKLKLKNKFIPISIQTQLTVFDITLKEYGKRKDTSYDKRTMKAGNVSAEDDENNYYKTIYSKLIKQDKNSRELEEIYSKNFDQICAIDKSYIYITVSSDHEKFDVVRVQKDGELYKTILEDISYVLAQDENYIYYISDGEEKIIYRLNREDCKTEKFAQFDYEVQLMLEQENQNFYVVTIDDAFGLGALFGVDNYYYVVGKDGTIINNYGSDPSVDQYYMQKHKNYNMAIKYMSYGRARSTATEVAFIGANGGEAIITTTDSGWAGKDSGIITQSSKSDGTGYDLNIYTIPNGELRTITTVQSRGAMFTMEETDSGEWYYLDQAGDEVTLYKLDSNLSNKSVVKTFQDNSFRCDLEKCNMEITDNVLYFYQVESNDTKVLDRYELR